MLTVVLMCIGTYIPPGPMLNSASTRLACLEDVEIDVSAQGNARRLFRRRVFAPEDNRDERYLTASDVVKVRKTSNCLGLPLLLLLLLLMLMIVVFVPEDKRVGRYLTASDVVKVEPCVHSLLLLSTHRMHSRGNSKGLGIGSHDMHPSVACCCLRHSTAQIMSGSRWIPNNARSIRVHIEICDISQSRQHWLLKDLSASSCMLLHCYAHACSCQTCGVQDKYMAHQRTFDLL